MEVDQEPCYKEVESNFPSEDQEDRSHMSDVNHFIDGKQVLPPSVWSQSNDFNIYRGTPSEMVLEMMGGEQCSVREALEKLVNHVSQTRNIQIQLPWQAPDEILANLFIYTLLQAGIVRPTPLA
jgi:hypothetical protein